MKLRDLKELVHKADERGVPDDEDILFVLGRLENNMRLQLSQVVETESYYPELGESHKVLCFRLDVDMEAFLKAMEFLMAMKEKENATEQ